MNTYLFNGRVLTMTSFHMSDYKKWIQNGCPADPNVTRITFSFSSKDIPHILPEIGRLVNVEVFELSNNGLTSLPVGFENLQNIVNLCSLDLSNNELDSFAIEICSLYTLKFLNLTQNNLTRIPKEIENLRNLECLKISCNFLSQIPSEIEKMLNLKELHITYNRLTSLPAELGNLVNLRVLTLSGNAITSLPDTIGKLQNLNMLTLDHNQLTSFPLEICNMQNLKHLNIGYNRMTSIPPEIRNLQILEELYLSHNALDSFPLEICDMRNLELICVEYNRITSLPPEIGNLQNLELLLTVGNEITHIPRNVARILERQLHGQGIYGDSQSVHNSNIQKTLKESILRLLNEKEIHGNVLGRVISDGVLNEFTKQSLVEYCRDVSVHTELNLTFHDLLVIVWNRILSLPASDEIKAVLNVEMRDAECMCFTGRISRLVNCLNGFDPLVTIRISDNEQIGNIISLVKTQLEENNEYTVERHKDIARTRLRELGIDDGVIEEWIENI